MQIQIRTQGFTLTRAIKSYVIQRLKSALSVRDNEIRAINVGLSDINGPKGGDDKQVKLEVALDGMNPVFVKSRKFDLYAAIDSASEKITRAVNRKISKTHNYRRSLVLQQPENI